MTRRWHWDFEGDHGERPSREPAPVSGPSRQTQVQRRRRVLLVTLIALIGILLAAMPRPGRNPSASSAPTHGATTGAATQAVNKGPGAVASVLAYTPFVKAGSTQAPDVAITFDDGPGPYTPEVLNVLEQTHTPATFFEVGRMIRYFGASTEREIRDGDVIGDHTQTHPTMAHRSAHEQREQLFEPIARIEVLGGPRPTL